ncbi:ATP-binding protein [Desulfogranum marinum]|uniref:ATP-binding protein n=1 Tax=Desulfogranum marinum TaxID=453220 RepID=UPI0019667CC6|nr:ATP-binding protein [Desulfogranum marinum]MBM9511233.1 ATP-binding protein [Desulfogranum marinum]
MAQTDSSLSIAADFGNLSAVKDFVRRQAKMLRVPERLSGKLELVVEELFLNIVNYAHPKLKEEVDIRCSRHSNGDTQGEMICIAIQDWGPPFNPLEKDNPALEQNVEERPIGGLGVYLVTQMADYCTYARQNENNCFTVCFHL